MNTSKKITMGGLGVAVCAGSVGTGVAEGLGSGLSTFAVLLIAATVFWWVFFE